MKVAFVPPWYGKGIPGGAESETYHTAKHLRAAGIEVEVLTTCVRDFTANWGRNYHRPGLLIEDGIPVRRFSVQRRDKAAFDDVNWKLMHNRPLSDEEEKTYIYESVRSPALEKYISVHQNDYVYIFIPYMFGTTYWGIEACTGKALLIPCLHNEAYARLQVFQRMFEQVSMLICHTESEMALASSLYTLQPSALRLVGGGVETQWSGDADRFRKSFCLGQPFILYAGRKDEGKNVALLIEYYRRYRQRRGGDVALVMIGGGSLPMSVSKDEGIYDLGFVSVQDKYDTYAAAELLCQPSLQESFSLVLMESWVSGTPVLVHSNCAVTKEHCVRSHGGLYFANYLEFETCLDVMLNCNELRQTLGRNGRRYVLGNYSWSTIVARYKTLINEAIEIMQVSD